MSSLWSVRQPREEPCAPKRAEVVDFHASVHATGRRLHRAALMLCIGDHHLAEHLTQATYTRVYVASAPPQR